MSYVSIIWVFYQSRYSCVYVFIYIYVAIWIYLRWQDRHRCSASVISPLATTKNCQVAKVCFALILVCWNMLGTQVIPWYIMMFPFKAYVSVVPDTIGWNYDCFYRFDRAIIADSRPHFGWSGDLYFRTAIVGDISTLNPGCWLIPAIGWSYWLTILEWWREGGNPGYPCRICYEEPRHYQEFPSHMIVWVSELLLCPAICCLIVWLLIIWFVELLLLSV
jgi:hypothetical protein